jgi:membrane-associated protein
MFNITGGVAWVTAFVCGGYFFGEMPWVKRNFHVVIIAIVILSILPPVIEYFRSRNRATPSEAS